jgi:hypothetical protein
MLLIGFLLGHQVKEPNKAEKRMRPYTIYIEDAAKFVMEKEKFLYLPYNLIYLYTLHITIRLTYWLRTFPKKTLYIY